MRDLKKLLHEQEDGSFNCRTLNSKYLTCFRERETFLKQRIIRITFMGK